MRRRVPTVVIVRMTGPARGCSHVGRRRCVCTGEPSAQLAVVSQVDAIVVIHIGGRESSRITVLTSYVAGTAQATLQGRIVAAVHIPIVVEVTRAGLSLGDGESQPVAGQSIRSRGTSQMVPTDGAPMMPSGTWTSSSRYRRSVGGAVTLDVSLVHFQPPGSMVKYIVSKE